MDEAELRAAVKDTIIDVEMARCGIMEGVERIMVIIGRFERGAGSSKDVTVRPLYDRHEGG
jgi:hypothetical protein